ncbi:ECF transporter S component [Protaetiibacter larvae]|uniref:ECF transporter S component n=1 Tax=Protaetiibacter larvae TaxID=2592654 RepID=A0A5C1Y868_9MICO|nr:ECF transporter S component [Protaetiibacter larvae]QEO09425.1 hypothetical protein FLP23_05025 [Protaetiibacter larvae]
MTTRLLLSCAAIAVVLGLASIPNAYLFNLLAVTAPWALGVATIGYILPGVLAQAALRRGGVGLLTQLLAGLVATPFVPTGVAALIAWVLLGILIELPFLIGLYRYWKPWLFWVSAVWVTAFYAFYWGLYYDSPASGPLVLFGQPAVLLAAMLLTTALALLLARLIARTGALRGIQAPVDRRKRRAAEPSAA